jgi:hypothetical protein
MLVYAIILGLIVGIINEKILNFALYSMIVLIISSFPFSFKVLLKDFFVGLISPVLVILRSFAFAFGLVFGVIRGVAFK